MKKIYSILILVAVSVFISQASAEPIGLVISEVKVTGGSGKTTDEFIELYNPTDEGISLAGWQLIKKTASGNIYPLVENFGEQIISSHSFYLIAHPVGYLGATLPDIYYSTTNSVASNNSILLIDENDIEIDKIGFGTAQDFEGESIPNIGTNKSIERKADTDSDEDTMSDGEVDYWRGNSFDSDNNKNDFITKDVPEPQNSNSENEYLDKIVVPDIVVGNTKKQSDKIIITELFPNPLGTDNNEFIELFNSGSEPIDLEDWQVGDNSTKKFKIAKDNFTETAIQPGQYWTIDKELSGISLNNTSDAAILYDYQGNIVDHVEYTDCEEAKSYILFEGSWFWSEDISPGAVNVFYINNSAPVAVFDLESSSFMVGQSIVLDGTESYDPDGDAIEYSWLVNSSEISKQDKLEYSFIDPGSFQIKLTVIDKWGELDTQFIDIQINDYDYSDQIIITEVLPSCTGADKECEFIEIYNGADREINLNGWSITDTKNFYNIDKELIIDSEDYLVIFRPDSKITLNNSGDEIYLIDPKGAIIFGIEYGQAKSDNSFAINLENNKWGWTDILTPGENNIFLNEQVKAEAEQGENNLPIEVAIKDITEELLGKYLIVSGEVESAKKTGIYLMDETGHTIRVYIQAKTEIPFPDVESGDFMQVTGLLDKTSAGLRLLPQVVEDIIITKKDVDEPNAAENPKVLGEETEKQAFELSTNENNKEVIKYLYITIGLLVIIVVAVTVKYYLSTKKDSQEEIDYSE